jgi:hypothetical protein
MSCCRHQHDFEAVDPGAAGLTPGEQVYPNSVASMPPLLWSLRRCRIDMLTEAVTGKIRGAITSSMIARRAMLLGRRFTSLLSVLD